MTLKPCLYCFVLLCVSCGQEPSNTTPVFAKPGYQLNLLSKDLSLTEMGERMDRYSYPQPVTLPKGILPKGYSLEDSYTTPSGYTFVAVENRSKRISVWYYDTKEKRRHSIRNLPEMTIDHVRMEWDALHHQWAVIRYAPIHSKSKNNGATIGVIRQRAYAPIITLETIPFFVSWSQGRIIVALTGAPGNNFKNYHKIMVLDPNKKTLETLYEEECLPMVSWWQSAMMSPDQQKLAFDKLNPFPDEGNGIWILDIATQQYTQVTFGNTKRYWHHLVDWKDKDHLEFIAWTPKHSQHYLLSKPVSSSKD